MQSFGYWSGLEYAPDTSRAWAFVANFGNQYGQGKSFARYALAVQPGDVVAAVPEPPTYALMLMGRSALVLARKRRR